MGLAERRAIKDFEDNHYPALKAQIDQTVGTEVELVADWEAIVAVSGLRVEKYTEFLSGVFLIPIHKAFEQICSDDMGKEALGSALKKIELMNSDTHLESRGKKFENGVLTIDQKLTNVDAQYDRVKSIVAILEAAL
jgi:hypothetical protein